MAVIFVHGVPETGVIWGPLIVALGLEQGEWRAPTYPGFGKTLCGNDFVPTLENYAAWLDDEVYKFAEASGQEVHIVGHDFGAALALRVSSMQPQKIKSWALMNSLIDSSLKPHIPARIIKARGLGELVLSVSRNKRLMRWFYTRQGVPADLAQQETDMIDPEMRRCVLSIYRTINPALVLDWERQLKHLPKKGLLIFGDSDPYVPINVAKRFAKRWGANLHIEHGAGHWAFLERVSKVANTLNRFWNESQQ